MSITRHQFLAQRSPRRGTANPEQMDMPVWAWLVEQGLDAYSANQRFDGPDPHEAGPGWCFDRFGMSRTALPDGRVVYVAGEHEDGYDPDFYIYNDVIVRHPDGHIQILGYAEDAFPPTDFHAATRVGERIVLIGNLGYPAQRRIGATQVAVLDLRDFSMALQETRGDGPGWIHDVEARLTDDGSCIVVSGGLVQHAEEGGLAESFTEYALSLASWTWQRIAERPHQQWEVRREDEACFELFHLGCVAFGEDYPDAFDVPGTEHLVPDSRQALADAGVAWDRALFERLFVPPIEHEPVQPAFDDEPAFGRKTRHATARLRVAEALVRYHDEMDTIQVVIEGELDAATTRVLLDDLCTKLERLHGVPCVAREMP